jgi:prepilin-type N-terminal cleavage/methylation domain-containing protein
MHAQADNPTELRHADVARRDSHRSGFTLIELLIVVVIIGILASIAIPKFGSTKEKAYLAAMKTDLRNLVGVQEAYAFDNSQTYYAGAIPNAALNFRPTTGVTIVMVGVVPGGWGATATHALAPTKTCAIYYGNYTGPLGPATVDGRPMCN